MTCRNAAPYLHETLAAIGAQTYPNWELIICNNQSTDKSLTIINDFKVKDKRIAVYTNPGLAEIIPGLQYAFSKSRGQIITRMDADDIMPEAKLETMVETLLSYGPGHVSTGCVRHFSAQELGEGFKKYDKWLNGLMAEGNNFNDIYRECVIPSSCWMVFREDFIEAGGFGRRIYPEDYDLCFRFYWNKLKVLGSRKVLHLWRDHPNRISRTDKRYEDQLYYDLKLYYFEKLDRDPQKQLVVWGAGKKGKKLAAKLKERSIPFRWICNNNKKIGHNIYGVLMESVDQLVQITNAQVLIAVSAKEKNSIHSHLRGKSIKHYWFC